MRYELDPQLAADTLPIAELPLSELRLMRDVRYPWLILVPRREAIRELLDLSREDQQLLLAEIDHCSRIARALHRPDKLNIAALGNVVSQLHIHLIARFRDDPAWPRPVWGVHPPLHDAARAATLVADWRAALAHTPIN